MLLIEILPHNRTFFGLMMFSIILAWSMLKKKSALIKNYVLSPETIHLEVLRPEVSRDETPEYHVSFPLLLQGRVLRSPQDQAY